jgi:hypothetical protein
MTVIHNGSIGGAISGPFVERFSLVRKLLICRKFNTCIKSEQFVKSFARRVVCRFSGI